MLLFGAAHIPIAMLVLPAFAGRLLWRLCHAAAPAAAAGRAADVVAERTVANEGV